MADFINTIDRLGDNAVIDSIIDRTITEFKDDKITKVGEASVFFGCKSLISVDLPSCTSVAENSFENCAALKSINIPGIITLPNAVFKGCAALESADFPLLTSIGRDSLQGCKSLREIDFPLLESAFGQQGYAGPFTNCIALTRANLPKLKTLGVYAFQGCTSLKCVDFPVLTSISGYAVFKACAELTALILRSAEMCSLGAAPTRADWNGMFQSTPIASGTGYIYVPRALVEDYKVATNWSDIADQFRALEDYTVDGTITGELDESKI